MHIAGIKSYAIQQANKPSSMNRKMFLKALSNDLCLNHLKIRAMMDNIPHHLKTRIQHFAGVISAVDNRPSVNKRPGRCGCCSSKKNTKTTTTWQLAESMYVGNIQVYPVQAVQEMQQRKWLKYR
ncbi:hypothetical protein C0J52_11203 [Blattella germanica]|nr:hypothetical protein C0J52_11203 [Blattella germanica]